MQLGSDFICDRRVKILGFIPTSWVCGGIMKPVPSVPGKLCCIECGHEKDSVPLKRLGMLDQMGWHIECGLVAAMLLPILGKA